MKKLKKKKENKNIKDRIYILIKINLPCNSSKHTSFFYTQLNISDGEVCR